MKIVAISGHKGSGKDASAEYLVEEHGYTRLSFADSLKIMVADQYNVPLHYMHDQEHKESALLQYPVRSTDGFTDKIHEILKKEFDVIAGTPYWTPRALCILEGSIKRSVQSSYWTQVILKAAKSMGDDAKVVIPDLRYKTEIDQILEKFPQATVARINRGLKITTDDPSERDLDDYSFSTMLDNTKDLPYLHQQLNKFK